MGNFTSRFTSASTETTPEEFHKQPAPTTHKAARRNDSTSGSSEEESGSSSEEEAPRRVDEYQDNNFDTQRALAASQDPANDVTENTDDLETAMRISKLEHTFTAGMGEEDGVNAAIEASLKEAERQQRRAEREKRREARRADEANAKNDAPASPRRSLKREIAENPNTTPAPAVCGAPFVCGTTGDHSD